MKDRMCCCLLIIFLDSPKLVPKCLPCWEEFPVPSDIPRPCLPIWEPYRKELPQLPGDLLLPSRLFTYLPMIWLILLLLLPFNIWMLLLCCLDLWLNWVFILPSILWILLLKCLILMLLEKIIIILLEGCKKCFKIINHYKILLLFWVWMNCPLMIN